MEEIKKKWAEIVKKYMNTKSAAVILIIGVLFMCIPSGSAKKTETAKGAASQDTYLEEYARNTEKRLCSILSTIEGVSDVSVMITLSDSGISQYEKNKNSGESESRSELSLKSQGSGQEEPVLVKKSLPSVLGVIVTAKGAGDPTKNSEIMSAVKAVLNVSAHRISVLSK